MSIKYDFLDTFLRLARLRRDMPACRYLSAVRERQVYDVDVRGNRNEWDVSLITTLDCILPLLAAEYSPVDMSRRKCVHW